eukprot:m.86472 g.86472  ORF g.86472 m.86472 type:complete len:515 (+) comp11465_c0_seq3:305-1849(+)
MSMNWSTLTEQVGHRHIPDTEWHSNNMTRVEGFREDALDTEQLTYFVIAAVVIGFFVGLGILVTSFTDGDDEGGAALVFASSGISGIVYFAGFVMAWVGVMKLLYIGVDSSVNQQQAYCLELRSQQNYSESCETARLVQEYFRADAVENNWLGVNSPLIGLAILCVILGVMIFLLFLNGPSEPAAIVGMCMLMAWPLSFLSSIAQGLETYVKSWPLNDCFLAICSHRAESAGLFKTKDVVWVQTMPPRELHDRWQGGVDMMFGATWVTLLPILSAVFALLWTIVGGIIGCIGHECKERYWGKDWNTRGPASRNQLSTQCEHEKIQIRQLHGGVRINQGGAAPPISTKTVVVSCPVKSSLTGKPPFNFDVVNFCEALRKENKIRIAFDRPDTSHKSRHDQNVVWTLNNPSIRNLSPDEKWREVKKSVRGSRWFQLYRTKIKEAISQLVQDEGVQRLRLISIAGGPISEVEQEAMNSIVGEVKKDMEKFGWPVVKMHMELCTFREFFGEYYHNVPV